ncbi:MAG: hypothetical protein ACK5HA_06415 [Planctomycetaceae bacterium]
MRRSPRCGACVLARR